VRSHIKQFGLGLRGFVLSDMKKNNENCIF